MASSQTASCSWKAATSSRTFSATPSPDHRGSCLKISLSLPRLGFHTRSGISQPRLGFTPARYHPTQDVLTTPPIRQAKLWWKRGMETLLHLPARRCGGLEWRRSADANSTSGLNTPRLAFTQSPPTLSHPRRLTPRVRSTRNLVPPRMHNRSPT
jgi:hypothetical protein